MNRTLSKETKPSKDYELSARWDVLTYEHLKEARASQIENWVFDRMLEGESFRRAGENVERIVDLDNAVASIGDDGQVELTCDTEEGPKFIRGRSRGDASSEIGAHCGFIDQRIRHVTDHLPADDAVCVINQIRDRLEQSCELAEARSRMLLCQTAFVGASERVDWFEAAVDAWDDEDREDTNPYSLAAARRIVGCVSHAYPDLRARVTLGLLGRVQLDWYLDDVRSTWLIDPTDSTFPSVRIYDTRSVPGGETETRMLYDMGSALEALRKDIEPDSHGPADLPRSTTTSPA